MKKLKILALAIWIMLWIVATCYGFRIMPEAWALWFDGNYNEAVRFAPALGVLIDPRPGALMLGPIALLGGAIIAAALYFKFFDSDPVENK